jgi:hypothetical protein
LSHYDVKTSPSSSATETTNLLTDGGSEGSSGTSGVDSPLNSPASTSDSLTTDRFNAAPVPIQLLQKDEGVNKLLPRESASSAAAIGAPARTASPPAVSPAPFVTVKPDPDAAEPASSSDKRKAEQVPIVLQQKHRNEKKEEEEERKMENGAAIDIADLADTVFSEEITRKRIHQLQQQRIHMGSIQVRRDIVEASSANSGERGLDLSWAAGRTANGLSSPDSRLANEQKQQRDVLARAVMQYPGGPPEGVRLYFPSGNPSFDSMNGVRGSQSPSESGLESVRLGIQVLRHAPRPPPLIRYQPSLKNFGTFSMRNWKIPVLIFFKIYKLLFVPEGHHNLNVVTDMSNSKFRDTVLL